MTTKEGIMIDDPLTMMVFGGISMSFMLAHVFAQFWVQKFGKNADLDALKAG